MGTGGSVVARLVELTWTRLVEMGCAEAVLRQRVSFEPPRERLARDAHKTFLTLLKEVAHVDRVEHVQHRLDCRVMPPGMEIPRLIRDPPLRRGEVLAGGVLGLHEFAAEEFGAGTSRVLEPEDRRGVVESIRSRGDIPVNEEQGSEALLSVEGSQSPVANLPIHKIEVDSLVSYERFDEDAEEVCADSVDIAFVSALRVVPLDERDLDTLDAVRAGLTRLEHAGE